jgi:hypothetical protein
MAAAATGQAILGAGRGSGRRNHGVTVKRTTATQKSIYERLPRNAKMNPLERPAPLTDFC